MEHDWENYQPPIDELISLKDAAKLSGLSHDHLRRLLEPAFPAIQAVFSEDGYIRFFSAERPFSIRIFGKGVTHVKENLYQLDQNLRSAAKADAIWSSLVFPRRSD